MSAAGFLCLAESMAVHQSTASNLIDKLSRLGLVERVKDENDLRVTYLHATPAAKQRLDGISGPVTGVLPVAIGQLSPDKLQILNEGLAELLSKMTEVELDAGQIPLAEILADR